MAKYEPYSRREMRRRAREWRRRNWDRVALATAAVAIVGVVVTVLMVKLSADTDFRWYCLGAMHAVLVTSYLWILNVAHLASDQEAIRRLRGAWGEENTRDELRRAKRRRVIWDWVDSINLQAGDLDHVVVTRRGGLVVLDSKWRNETNDGDRIAMARSAQRARQRCEGVARTLLRNDRRARHRARNNPLAVRSAVVMWGALQAEIPDGAQVEGVEFVTGRRLVEWLRSIDGDPVPKAAARDVVERLREFRAAAWDAADQTRTRASGRVD